MRFLVVSLTGLLILTGCSRGDDLDVFSESCEHLSHLAARTLHPDDLAEVLEVSDMFVDRSASADLSTRELGTVRAVDGALRIARDALVEGKTVRLTDLTGYSYVFDQACVE